MPDTEEFWQKFTSPPDPPPCVWIDRYLAPMRDGSALALPLRDYGATALAGLISNQASFAVLDTLASWIAHDVADVGAEIVVGLPTLGHAVGAAVARALGHRHWVAPSMTRKWWYDQDLSVPIRSVTSPQAGRTLWLDPRLRRRLAGRKVLLVDDVICTGRSARAGIALLARAGIVPAAVAVVMSQGQEWQAGWDVSVPVYAALATPVFRRAADGWIL